MRVENNLKFDEVLTKVKAGIQLFGETAGKDLEAKAKANAPWTDRTTNARNSIQGGFQWNDKNGMIYVSGDTDYFKYLELYHEKKWAILWPTITENQSEILNAFEGMLDKVNL